MVLYRRIIASIEALLLAAAILLGIGLRFDLDTKSIDFDAGLFAYTAQRVLNDPAGTAHYTDYFDNMPPLIYKIYGLSYSFWGQTPRAVHMTSVVPDIAVIFLVFLLGRFWISNRAGLWAAALYSLSYVPLRLSHFGQSENAAMATVLLALLIFSRTVDEEPDKRRVGLLLAGVFLGMGSMIKQPVVFYLLALGLYMALMQAGRWRMLSRSAAHFSIIAAGFAAFLLLTGLVLLACGILYEAVYACFLFPFSNQDIYGMTTAQKWAEFMVKGASLFPFLLVLAAVGLLRLVVLRERWLLLAVTCLLCVTGFYCWTGDFFQHYLLYALPLLALLAGGAVDFAQTAKRMAPLRLVVALIVVAVIGCQYDIMRRARYGYGEIVDERTGTLEYYYRHDNSLRYQLGMANCIREHMEPGDRIFSTTPTYNFLLNEPNNYTQYYVAPLTRLASGGFENLDEYLDRTTFALIELSRRDYLPTDQVEEFENRWERVRCTVEGSSPNSVLVFRNPNPQR